ncbi:MAG: LysR family transcriptional regulator [bacterium]|nr:LysR family transcriptional regulator [bacterium]
MEIRQLLYFVTVAEELHFSNAAKRLHMTQPPLSMQIRRLEEELDLKLFERTKRSVRLTAAGEAFHKHAVSILEKVDHTMEFCRRTSVGEVGELKLGIVPVALDTKILGLVKKLQKGLRNVRLALFEMDTTDLLAAVRSDRLSVGFVQTYDHDLGGLESVRVASETFWLAVPENHDIARLKKIPLSALEGVNLILPPTEEQQGIVNAVVGSCRQAGFEPRTDFAVSGQHTALALAAGGLGVTPVARSASRQQTPGVVYRPVSAVWPKMEITMVWKRHEENAVLRRFLEVVDRGRVN